MKKEEITKIDRKKEILKGVFGFLLYFILYYTSLFVLAVFNNSISINQKQIYLILHCIVTMLIFTFLYLIELKKGFKELRKNYKDYFKKYFKYWLFAIAIMYISNLAIALIKYKYTGDYGIAQNEEGIRDTMKLAPIYVVFAASIYAPYVEELTFRHSIRKIFKNNVLFILVSGLIFGSMHVFHSGMTALDLLYLVPYSVPGMVLAYIYVKTNNITSTISLHMIHNTILMILEIILLSKGLL